MSYIYFCLFLKMFYIFCVKLGTGIIPAYYYSVTSRSYVNSCHCLCSNKMTALNSSTLTKQLATLIIGLGVAPTVCVCDSQSGQGSLSVLKCSTSVSKYEAVTAHPDGGASDASCPCSTTDNCSPPDGCYSPQL